MARNSLLKCALAGSDPNWGRVLTAVGTTDAVFEPDRINVAMNGTWVCRSGAAFEDRSKADLSGQDITITVDLSAGPHSARHPHHRPDRGLRARELGLLDMTIVIAGGRDAARRAAATAKAGTLIEALPWLDRFHGATVVIKYGGHAMTADELRAGFAEDLVFLRHAGLRPVVVHGGGPQVTSHLERLGIESRFTAGLRVTTEETIDVVRMVLNGKVNKDIVGLVNRFGPYAVGLSGEDANLFTAERQLRHGGRRPGRHRPGRRDHRRRRLDGARAARRRPHPGRLQPRPRRRPDGAVYNVNADTAAAALAVALGADKLVVLTDVEGLYRDWPNSDEVISSLDAGDLEKLLPSLSAGMIPKMEACLTAVRGGVPTAHVLDGRLRHAILLEMFTDSGIGTMVIEEDPA